ncbi:MAG: SPOR domain-containing protein [Rudaea sp.]|nr:SPOR domain-containing protein [Rudaea sp.]
MAGKRTGKQAFRENERQSWPAWVWLGLGVLLGLTLSAIMLIKEWVPMLHRKNLPQPNPEATAPKEPDQAVADEAGKKPAPPKKTYDFYSVLPEMEVVIPDAELSAKAKAEQQRQQQAMAQSQSPNATASAPAPPADAGSHYFLQAGSYPDAKGADEAKAKLALLGFIAKVQPITINGKTWNRVRVGPYASASELETAKKALADSGVNAIALKEAPSQ